MKNFIKILRVVLEISYNHVTFEGLEKWNTRSPKRVPPRGSQTHLKGKKDTQPPREREGVVKEISAIRTIGARQRANGLSSVGKVFEL